MKDIEKRKNCPMRSENGNCSVVGGFCIDAVSDEICEAMQSAYNKGFIDCFNSLKQKN